MCATILHDTVSLLRIQASGEPLKFTKRAIDGAAAAGHLEMVRWLHGKQAECTTDAMDLAAQEGHLEVVEVRETCIFSPHLGGMRGSNHGVGGVFFLPLFSGPGKVARPTGE